MRRPSVAAICVIPLYVVGWCTLGVVMLIGMTVAYAHDKYTLMRDLKK